MATSGFEAGAKKVDGVRKKMSADYAKFSKAQARLDKNLSNVASKRIKAEEALSAAQKAGVKNLRDYRRALRELSEEESALIAKQKELSGRFSKDFSEKSGMRINIGGASNALRALGVAGAAAGASFGALKVAADKLDEIGKSAEKVNVSATALYELRHQASLAGVKTEALSDGLKKLALSGGSVKQSMIELADKAEQGTLSVAEAQKVFGKNALEMINILKQGKDAIEDAFSKNYLDDATKAAAEFNDILEASTHGIMPELYKVGGRVLDGWNAMIAYWRDGLDYHEYKLKQLNEQTARENKAREAAARKEAQEAQARLETLDEYDKMLTDFRRGEMSDLDKVLDLKHKIGNAEAELLQYEEDSVEYGERYKRIVEDTIALEKLEAKLSKEKSEADKKRADEEAKKIADAKKQAETEAKAAAKAAAEKAKQIALAREEFEIQFKIKKLEQGTTQQQAQAQAIKNAQERNELMKKYGYDIETANKALKAMKELEGGDKVEYSKKDIEKAQKMIERGAGGSVGKKSLEQAQAILDGKKIEGKAVAAFDDAQKKAQSAQLQIAPDSVLQRNAPLAIPSLNSTPQSKEQGESKENKSPEILEMERKIHEVLGDIKTSFNQFLKQYKPA